MGVLLAAGSAAASPVGGEVVGARGRWRGDRIVTDVTVRLADGRQVSFTQPGGSVDGIGMRQWPAPPRLRAGDRVDLDLDLDRAGPETAPRILNFVRTTNEYDSPLYWSSGCVFITYNDAGTIHVAGTQEFAVMDAVFERWRADTAECSYLRFQVGAPAALDTRFDRQNVIKFREARWCRPAHDDVAEECYDTDAAALTTLYFIEDQDSERDGEILDADIEINAVNFVISVDGVTEGGPGCMSDLAATLTHEVGHVMGLDHTCWTGTGDQPVDDQGNPVPSCGAVLPPEVTEATMYNFQDCGETKKASPEADDIDGVCAIYPLAGDPGTCVPVPEPDGCCSSGGAPATGSLLLAGIAAALLTRRRRSR